jgi:putative CocE/NonD family hydrolase
MSEEGVRLDCSVRIPLRDGVHLSAILYLPERQAAPSPAIVTLTPYVAQSYHDQGISFASHGYPFLVVDVRGRGNSAGEFDPNVHEGRDGYDVVEWLARQPYCNGRVGMWGGSYAGHAQWNAASQLPPHLATIVPVASPRLGLDFPFRSDIGATYVMQWLTLVAGRTSQEKMFADQPYWNGQFRRWFEGGAAYRDLDRHVGNPSPIFQRWIAHAGDPAFWDAFNPTAEEYGKLELPVLTITGMYDGDQPGALMHYREHWRHATPDARARHYLVIGPWDHAGTRAPQAEFSGVKAGPRSLLDLAELHRQWYAWTLQGAQPPAFLRRNVAYYVLGADLWRYADSLDHITSHSTALYLHSQGDATDVFHSGALALAVCEGDAPDEYRHDPRDVSLAALESTIDPEDRSEQRMVHAMAGKQLVYHSGPFAADAEISGFFRFTAWISIDQPDTDFRVSIYEIGRDGNGLLLTSDARRARYRSSLREPQLVQTAEPLRYDFDNFTFVSRLVRQGSRLRLILAPIHSIFHEKNYNTGGTVAAETMKNARTVRVQLFHDREHPSALHVPFGRCEDV